MKSAAPWILTMGLLIAGSASNLEGITLAARQAPITEKSRKAVYDGNWWLTKEVDERGAFIDGADDCLTWVAHVKGFLGTGDQLQEKITQYYETHPVERTVPVMEVCRKLARGSPVPKPSRGGEVWTNPHWYLNGLYWRQLNYETAQQAFLEGYLWCMRTCVGKPTETYSRPIAYYVHRISNYIKTHPKTADDEAIADILSRFRDNSEQVHGAVDPSHE